MDWEAIGLSLRLSACTTAVLIGLGMPLAWWLGRTSWRGRHFIEAVVALPIVLPPTVLGYYVLLAISPRSPVGRMYESIFGLRLPFSFQGLLVASVLYSLPFAVQPFQAALRAVPRLAGGLSIQNCAVSVDPAMAVVELCPPDTIVDTTSK
mgnify:CR=1 FL=1